MHSRTLYDGALVKIFDVRCRPDHPDGSGEECTSGHHVVFPRTGVFVKHVRGRKIVADPNHVLFFNAGEGYRVSHPVPGGDDCTVFSFRDDVLIETWRAVDPRVQDSTDRPFEATHGLAPAATLLPQRALRFRLSRGEAGALEAEETAVAVLRAVAQGNLRDPSVAERASAPRRPRAANARLRRDWIEATKLRLAARPEADPTLAALAREVGCSPFHLARLFRDAHGIPIHQYQLRLRLVLALERLLDGSESLLTLALDLGFANHSHFSAAFKRAFGATPSAFRRTATVRRAVQMSKILTV